MIEQFEQFVVQVGDGFLHFPFRFIPFAHVIGNGPQLDEGNFFLQAYIMQGSAFHRFDIGLKMFNELLLLQRAVGYGIHGYGTNAMQRNLVSDLATVREPSIGEGEFILICQSALEERSEAAFFFGTEVAEAILLNPNRFTQGDVRIKCSGNTSLDDEVVIDLLHAFLQVIKGGGHANTGDQEVDRGTVPGEEFDFVGGSRKQQYLHGANFVFVLHISGFCRYLCANFDDEMVYVTRTEHFNAAHKLYNPRWTKEQNDAVFGRCANENWHGHNFELDVTIKGNPDPDTGFVYDVKKLSAIINEHVIEKLDHKNLNLDVDFMAGKMCSIENLVIGIWNQLVPHLPEGVKLHCLKLRETPKIYTEYYGD